MTLESGDRSGSLSEMAPSLRAGDGVELTGRMLTLRDASAARLAASLARGHAPVSLDGSVLYAVGPSPAKPGQVVGSAGPTTTARMGRYLPALLSAGVCAIVGKGTLEGEDERAFIDHGALYFAAIGGLGALLSKHIVARAAVAYDDLGPEALLALDVERFPCVVVIDRHGNNLHVDARRSWRRG